MEPFVTMECPTCLQHGVRSAVRPTGDTSVRVSVHGHATLLVPYRCPRCGATWKSELLCRDYEPGNPPEANPSDQVTDSPPLATEEEKA